MKIIIVILISFLYSCSLDNDLIDYYNDCNDTEIEFKTSSIFLENNLHKFPMKVYVAENQRQYERGGEAFTKIAKSCSMNAR